MSQPTPQKCSSSQKVCQQQCDKQSCTNNCISANKQQKTPNIEIHSPNYLAKITPQKSEQTKIEKSPISTKKQIDVSSNQKQPVSHDQPQVQQQPEKVKETPQKQAGGHSQPSSQQGGVVPASDKKKAETPNPAEEVKPIPPQPQAQTEAQPKKARKPRTKAVPVAQSTRVTRSAKQPVVLEQIEPKKQIGKRGKRKQNEPTTVDQNQLSTPEKKPKV